MSTLPRLALTLGIACAFCACTSPRRGEIRSAVLRSHVYFLAGDALAGRFPGTEGERVAASYIAGALADAGLEPAGDAGSWFEAVEGCSFEYRQLSGEPIVGRNVVGKIRGAGRPHELVVLSAHYDHLGVPEEQVMNGANDNASGAAALLEIARAMGAGTRPSRSVVFAFFTMEEYGLCGSEEWVRRHTGSVSPPIVCNLNLDMLGAPDEQAADPVGTFYLTGAAESGLRGVLRRGGVHLQAPPDHVPTTSDHYSFTRAGIRAHLVTSGAGRYHHGAGDDPDTLDYEHLTRGVQLCHRAARVLAEDESLTAGR